MEFIPKAALPSAAPSAAPASLRAIGVAAVAAALGLAVEATDSHARAAKNTSTLPARKAA